MIFFSPQIVFINVKNVKTQKDVFFNVYATFKTLKCEWKTKIVSWEKGPGFDFPFGLERVGPVTLISAFS